MRDTVAFEYLTREGNFRVPCSRYGFDTESCAPVAYALSVIMEAETGEAMTFDKLDADMGLVVNDHDDVYYVLTEYGAGRGVDVLALLDWSLFEDHAEALGREHGEAAASWFFDGNTTDETYRYILDGIESGDPEVLDKLPSPDLSGQWADVMSGPQLADEILPGWEDMDGADRWFAAICEAYEQAFMDAVETYIFATALGVLS